MSRRGRENIHKQPVSPSLPASQLCPFYPRMFDGSNLYIRPYDRQPIHQPVSEAFWSKQPTQIRWGWLLLRFELMPFVSGIPKRCVCLLERGIPRSDFVCSLGQFKERMFWIVKSRVVPLNVQTIPGWRNGTSSQTPPLTPSQIQLCPLPLSPWKTAEMIGGGGAKNDLKRG